MGTLVHDFYMNDAVPTPLMTINGDLEVTGTKNFVQQHPVDPTKKIVYVALEAGKSGTYAHGSARLKNGVARVELPEHFALITNVDG